MKKCTPLIILFTCLSAISIAQKQSPFRQFKIEHWDTKKGMPNDLSLNVLQTMDGFLWLTGYNGLVRFDGVDFTAFNQRTVPLIKTDNMEGLMAETADTSLWIPTPTSGLLRYRKGAFSAYLTDLKTIRLLGKTSQDELLLSLDRGVRSYILFDTHTFSHTVLSSASMLQMFKDGRIVSENITDKSGNQWRNFPRPMRINHGIVYPLTEKEGLQNKNNYLSFYVDSKDRVWLPSSFGLLIWNGKSFVPFPGMENKTFLPANATKGLLLEDSQGGIWAASETELAYLEPNAEKFVFTPDNSPVNAQNINCIIEDKEKNIWLSSETGLFKISRSKFINYSAQDGLNSNRVDGVCAMDNHRFLAITTSAVYLIENGFLRPYPFKNKLIPKKFLAPFHVLQDSKKNIWISSSFAITKLSPEGETQYGVDGQVRFAFEDTGGKIWFGVPYMGIGFLNQKEQFEFLDLPKVDFKTLFISSIRKLQNGNWLVTSYNKGMLLIDTQGNPVDLGEDDNLSSIGIFNSYEDPDGTLWLSSQSGIIRYKNGNFDKIGFNDGIPENSLFGFLPDHKGYVWFPSNRGLIRALKQEMTDYLDKKAGKINWQLYDDGDGMLNRQCVGARHSDVTPDGKLLIATLGGLVVVDPDQLSINPLAPQVVIHRVLRDNERADLTKNESYAPGSHRYIFEYSALSLIAPEKVKIKFRLIGYDKEWISSIGDRKAYYTNLPKGKYTFQVIAGNNDGIWNEKGASYTFVVRPFFYETLWFRFLALIFGLVLIWIVIRWRTKTARKKNELLELQVESRTKDLNRVNSELIQSNTEIAIQRDNLTKTIGELKSTQSQLIQSEKMASLGELTAGIAHEIQNPLNFVNNFSEINTELIQEMKDEMEKGNLEEAKTIARDIAENEQKINHHGKRADAIVKGMLQHSRSSNGVKEPTDINALADEYLRLAYHGLRAKDKSFNAIMKTDFDESIDKVMIVPQDIGRVILNLITNAFYAVETRRKVPQGLENLEGLGDYEPTVSVSSKKMVDKILISVKDNGSGIPAQIIDKIFQPFFTTKPAGEGTGLGLSMSYEIITKGHGGELKVGTTEGEGSEFTILLPI